MRKLLIICIAVISLISCKREAKTTERSGNFDLEFLFEKDGCKVYRFFDGEYVYWANCSGTLEHHTTRNSGKSQNTHKTEAFTTVLK